MCYVTNLLNDHTYLSRLHWLSWHAVSNFTMVMATMTVHIFPTYTYWDQRQYMQRYLRMLPDIKVRTLQVGLFSWTCTCHIFCQTVQVRVSNIPSWWWHQGNSIPYNTKYVEKEDDRIDIQLLRWSYPFYGRSLRDKDCPPSVPSRNRKKRKKGPRKGKQ